MAPIILLYLFNIILLIPVTYQKDRGKECQKCGHGFGHPWYAKLYCQRKPKGDVEAFCNAALVSPWIIITSSSCVGSLGIVFLFVTTDFQRN